MGNSNISLAETTALRKLDRLIAYLRTIQSDMQVQQAQVLLAIAQSDGTMTVGELSKKLNVAQSTASRNVRALSEFRFKAEAGHGLVVARLDPMEIRRKYLHLTPDGVQVVKHIVALMED